MFVSPGISVPCEVGYRPSRNTRPVDSSFKKIALLALALIPTIRGQSIESAELAFSANTNLANPRGLLYQNGTQISLWSEGSSASSAIKGISRSLGVESPFTLLPALSGINGGEISSLIELPSGQFQMAWVHPNFLESDCYISTGTALGNVQHDSLTPFGDFDRCTDICSVPTSTGFAAIGVKDEKEVQLRFFNEPASIQSQHVIFTAAEGTTISHAKLTNLSAEKFLFTGLYFDGAQSSLIGIELDKTGGNYTDLPLQTYWSFGCCSFSSYGVAGVDGTVCAVIDASNGVYVRVFRGGVAVDETISLEAESRAPTVTAARGEFAIGFSRQVGNSVTAMFTVINTDMEVISPEKRLYLCDDGKANNLHLTAAVDQLFATWSEYLNGYAIVSTNRDLSGVTLLPDKAECPERPVGGGVTIPLATLQPTPEPTFSVVDDPNRPLDNAPAEPDETGDRAQRTPPTPIPPIKVEVVNGGPDWTVVAIVAAVSNVAIAAFCVLGVYLWKRDKKNGNATEMQEAAPTRSRRASASYKRGVKSQQPQQPQYDSVAPIAQPITYSQFPNQYNGIPQQGSY